MTCNQNCNQGRECECKGLRTIDQDPVYRGMYSKERIAALEAENAQLRSFIEAIRATIDSQKKGE